MKHRVVQHALLLCLMEAGVIAGTPAYAAIDGLEAARSNALSALRWENIKGTPYWFAGKAPSLDKRRGWHVVELTGTEGVAIHVPAHALLRIVAEPNGSREPPQLLESNGTGLAVERALLEGTDGSSWLLKTMTPHPTVIHLRRAGGSEKVQRLALFLGQVQTPDAAVTYRHALAMPGEKVQVRRADEAAAQTYTRIHAGQEIQLPVTGRDRVLVEYRLQEQATPENAVLAMDAQISGLRVRTIRQPTGPETLAPVNIDGAWRAASRKERVAIDIPDGAHQLKLRLSHTVLLRAAIARDPDFLFPALNFPDAWRDIVSDSRLEAAEQKSVAAATSNQWRDIGQLAGQHLRREAAAQPGLENLHTAADELAGQFLQYQDLMPVNATEIEAHSIAVQLPQDPLEAPRSHIIGSVAASAPLPVALFHRIGDKPVLFSLPRVSYALRVRALLPIDAAAVTIEVRHDDGTIKILEQGMPALADEKLRPVTGGMNPSRDDAWPSTLSGHADRNGAVAPLAHVASVEWEVPDGTKSISIRSAGNTVPIAMQWGASSEYFLDDDVLAELAQHRSLNHPGSALQQDALRPLERMLAAARAQFVANVAPPSSENPVDKARAKQAAEKAMRESDPVRAVELWQIALRSPDIMQRADALRGMASTLFAAGERFGGERLLRSHWIGDDLALKSTAQVELNALYAREGDGAMQHLFAAARAVGDSTAYASLSKTLAADGEEAMALLAGLSASERDLPALLQSAIRSRRWKTFDALLQQLEPQRDVAFWSAQRALSRGETAQALRHFDAGGHADWTHALQSGDTLATALRGNSSVDSQTIDSWLDWQSTHPGMRLWRNEPVTLVRHGGGLAMRSIALNLRSKWWRASAAQPLVTRIVGPARIRVEARPMHESVDSLFTGRLHIKAAGQLWLQAFHQNQPSPGLEFDGRSTVPGGAVIREIALPPGVHELSIDAGSVPIVARLLVERPALQLPVMPAPSIAHFNPHAGWTVKLNAASACGDRYGCHLIADGALTARTPSFEKISWPGLSIPRAVPDALASRLASGDFEGALKLTADPKEQMQILLWLSDTRPEQRARALALGSAIAKEHPSKEIRTQWEQLSSGSGWAVLPTVDRSAGLRPIEVAQGTPESPTARMRAVLLASLRAGEVRIGGDTRATLVFEQPASSQLSIELSSEDMPGAAPLPVTAVIERNGKLLRELVLEPGKTNAKFFVKVPAGAQQISVFLKKAYANQFLRVHFAGAAQPEFKVSRDWHIATAAQPVRLTLGGPAWVRIDRLDKSGVHSEERLVNEAVSTLTLPPQRGEAETLYRIYQRQATPGNAAPSVPRPNNYRPSAVPEAPAEWIAESQSQPLSQTHSESQSMALPPPKQVRFIDAERLEAKRNSTLSVRAAITARRDIEASGAEGGPVPELFTEHGVSWRHRSDDETESRLVDLFTRFRITGSPVIGFRVAGERLQQWSAALPWPFTLNASISGFAQNTRDGIGASLVGRIAASQARMITPILSHRPTIELSARAMNLDSVSDSDRSRVDTDIFSSYREQHKRALSVSDTLSFRPWRDTHLSARLSATSNPDLNIAQPDNYGAELQWRQLLGPVIVEAGRQVVRYRADADRSKQSSRREWRLGASYEWWLGDGSRLELLANLRRDIDIGSHSGGIEFRWHWGPGRQLRDFASNELDFRSIRSWRAPTAPNRIEEQ